MKTYIKENWKSIVFYAIILGCIYTMPVWAKAATPADTIRIQSSAVTKVIADNTTDSKGNAKVKYYAIVNGELVNTSKTVVERIALCKKHGARYTVAIVKRGNNKRLIIL